jgi:RHS repeat-associated protein
MSQRILLACWNNAELRNDVRTAASVLVGNHLSFNCATSRARLRLGRENPCLDVSRRRGYRDGLRKDGCSANRTHVPQTPLFSGRRRISSKDPFGNILSKSGPLADANTCRFSSQEYHQPSGLSLYLYRVYDPNLQRWLNRDPMGEWDGSNLYTFVHNDPMNWVDVTGLAGWRIEPGHGQSPGNPAGWHFQLGDNRWDARTLQPLPGNTQAALTPSQLEELRQAGYLDKAAKLFPEGVVAREAAEAGLTAGKILKLSKNIAKPLCKNLARAVPVIAVAGAVSDIKAIGQTAVTGAQAAAAAGKALSSTLETQSKMNSQRLMNADDLSDDEITHWMSRRIGR